MDNMSKNVLHSMHLYALIWSCKNIIQINFYNVMILWYAPPCSLWRWSTYLDCPALLALLRCDASEQASWLVVDLQVAVQDIFTSPCMPPHTTHKYTHTYCAHTHTHTHTHTYNTITYVCMHRPTKSGTEVRTLSLPSFFFFLHSIIAY